MVEAGVPKEKSEKFNLSNTIILFVMLTIMVLFFSSMSKSFYSYLNLSTMLANLSFIGIIAAPLTLVMITGGLDISVGGVIGLTSCLVAWLYNAGMNIYLVILIGLLVGGIVGATNGFFVTRVGINPIITTLGTMAVTRGLGFVISGGRSILIMEDVVGFLGRGMVWKIPSPVILMAIVYGIFHFLLRYSKFGRHVYAVGGNAAAAYTSGIKVKKVTFITYLLCGFMAALGGLILTSLTAVGMPQHGMGLELSIISAVILGGTALGGGRGQMVSTLIGVLIISVLYNGLTMLNLLYYFVQIAQGTVLILVVAAYEIRVRRMRRFAR